VRLVDKAKIDVLKHYKQNPNNDEEINEYIEFSMENYGINEILKKIHGNNDELYNYDRKKIMRIFSHYFKYKKNYFLFFSKELKTIYFAFA